ncbi:MAG TPA: insulinase family protein [Rectinemataceae bacterium]|nr:insulinase family protein [Rectinemataceae bacterium]
MRTIHFSRRSFAMKRALLAALCLLILSLAAQSEEGSLPNLSRFRLSNGLEVFAYRDSALPLARVQISFRAGAMAQGPETAGLFRLYERMLFHGEPALPGDSPLRSALAGLGLAGAEGGTTAESVAWWITVPSARTDEALALWSSLCREPAFDSTELEARKAECLRAIAEGAKPDTIYEAAITRRLFAKYPWRRDPAGSEKAINSASLDSLRTLQRTWFVPNNAALMVAGDIDPEAVRASAERLFGAWKPGDDPWKKPLPPQPKPGVPRPTWIVYPDPSVPEGVASVEARYRGPDALADIPATYGGDLWSALVSSPEGKFKTAVMKTVPKLFGPESIQASYATQRDGAWISISSFFYVDPALPAVDRARLFKERVRGFEITAMKTDPSYFSAKDYEDARRRLLVDRDLGLDTPDGVLDALAFWWSSSSVDYFLGYPAAMAKAGPKELGAFLDTYIMRNLEVVALRMNPADYEREKKSFAGSGFELVTPSNAFWWQK